LREKCHYGLRGCGRVCIKWNPVGVPRRRVAVKDGEYALSDSQGHDQSKEPERDLVTSISIIDALGKKFVEHGSSFRDD
jgi:hypothetical protein